jgi:hypothetical protein
MKLMKNMKPFGKNHLELFLIFMSFMVHEVVGERPDRQVIH